MRSHAAEMLMQTGRDCVALFGHAPDADCRMLPHGWIALSGEPLAADLNMLGLTADADEREFSQALESVQGRGLDVLLIVDEGAEAARWARAAGLNAVARVPLMERRAAPLEPRGSYLVHRAEPDQVEATMRLAATAFSLDEAAVVRVMPASLFAASACDLWVVEEAGRVLGCGIFVRSGDHAGIYTMATPVENQRRGVGGAVLATAMAHYQDDGVTRFTLGATEQGFGLYERMGFEVVSRPEVFVIGQSTQFSGD